LYRVRLVALMRSVLIIEYADTVIALWDGEIPWHEIEH